VDGLHDVLPLNSFSLFPFRLSSLLEAFPFFRHLPSLHSFLRRDKRNSSGRLIHLVSQCDVIKDIPSSILLFERKGKKIIHIQTYIGIRRIKEWEAERKEVDPVPFSLSDLFGVCLSFSISSFCSLNWNANRQSLSLYQNSLSLFIGCVK